MFSISSIRIQNFLGVENVVLALDKLTGLVVIHGKNGAGKTIILDALSWCLYGKMLRRIPVAKIMNRFAKRGECSVSVCIEDLRDDSRAYTITRARTRTGGATLDVTGLKGGTATGKQEAINSLLGMDHTLFTNSVVFGGEGIASFCQLGDAQRKEVLEELIGVGYFLKAREIAAKEVSRLSDEEHKLRTAVQEAEEVIESATSEIESLREKSAQHLGVWRGRLRQLRHALASSVDDWGVARDQLCRVREAHVAEEAEYAERYAEYEKWVGSQAQDLAAADEAVSEQRGIVRATEDQLTIAREELRKYEEGKHPETCPTCGQPWPSSLAVDDKPLKYNITQHETNVQKARHTLNTLRDKAAKMRAKLESRDEPVAPDKAVIRKAQQICDAFYRTYITALQTIQALPPPVDPYVDMIEDRQAEVDDRKARLPDLLDDLEEAAAEVIAVHYWVKAFSKQGIPALLLDAVAPDLNRAVKRYVSHLMPGARIRFNPAQEKGEGTVFAVEVVNPNGADLYAGSSKGERTRVDLCVLLAIRDLMSVRSAGTFAQVFLDEIFDGLDADGTESVVALLNDVFRGQTVFLVTHEEGLKSASAHSILVNKEDRCSQYIVE